MNKYPQGSESYEFWDARQKTVKIVMNSTYGLMGLSVFRYSNHWLAKSITVQGRLTLKIAQIIGEKYLEKYKEKINGPN